MSRLLSRFTLFIVTGIAFFFLIFQVNQLLFKSEPYLLDEHIHIIATGASRTANSVYPEVVENTVNIAEPQFPYVVHYHILKHILQHNPQVDTYIIGYTPTHLSGILDYIFAVGPGNVRNLFEMIYPIMRRRDYERYPIHLKKYIKSLMRHQIVPNWTYLKNKFRKQSDKEFPFIGGTIKEEGSHQSEEMAKARVRKHFYRANGTEYPVSDIDIGYLDSMAVLTRQRGVKMILLRTPVHKLYQDRIPEKFIDAYEGKKEALLNQYDHLVYLDYQSGSWPDSCFLDTDHLNIKGGKVLSERLEETLENL